MSEPNPIISEHVKIWEQHHRSHGISLRESATDWLDLLDADPEMVEPTNWGDLAGNVTPEQVYDFRAWLWRARSSVPAASPEATTGGGE